jgi:hypothetical protein
VLRDWADGTIDRTFPRRCYGDALDNMPEDLRIYSSAEDDIRRALLNVETASGARAARAQPRRRTLAAHGPRRATAAVQPAAATGCRSRCRCWRPSRSRPSGERRA